MYSQHFWCLFQTRNNNSLIRSLLPKRTIAKVKPVEVEAEIDDPDVIDPVKIHIFFCLFILILFVYLRLFDFNKT